MRGPFMPAAPFTPCPDQAAFNQSIREIGRFAQGAPKAVEMAKAMAEALFDLPRHAVVFTHGDLSPHNVMVCPDGHVSGIFDWEGAAWLPEYWEISVVSILPRRSWEKFFDKQVSEGIYDKEVTGHRGVFALVQDWFSGY